jgi:hypothetical protein
MTGRSKIIQLPLRPPLADHLSVFMAPVVGRCEIPMNIGALFYCNNSIQQKNKL